MPLKSEDGHVTSHLVGLAFRTTKLIANYNMRLIFVFDGRHSPLKRQEVERRREARAKAEKEYLDAINRGDYSDAFSKAVMTGKLSLQMIADSKRLLEYLGIPWVQAPAEGEAQAAFMASKGDVWAVNSRDYDSLLFGAPRLVRYVTIQGREFLPSKGLSRRLEPEIIVLEAFLRHQDITRTQLVDLAIMIGTDFNEGIKGIGPKKALKLVEKHGFLEDMPQEVKKNLPSNYLEIRKLYLEPEITNKYEMEWGSLNEDGLFDFLCGERSFSRQRVDTIAERMRQFYRQKSLTAWLKETS
jgi:flap endonuclease-1